MSLALTALSSMESMFLGLSTVLCVHHSQKERKLSLFSPWYEGHIGTLPRAVATLTKERTEGLV